MHDEFLHRLRKEPRPEFAMRLQARLRRQSRSLLPPQAPSRVRTLLTLLLIGGTAFAVTVVVMRGIPTSLLNACHYAAAWIRAERSSTPVGQVANQGFRQGWGWGASGSSSPPAAAPRTGLSHSAAPTAGTQAAVTSSAESADSAPSVGGAELRIPHIRAVSSWAAYPYAKDIADRSNSSSEPADVPASHIDVSEQDSDMWPGPMCDDNATAPDIAYAFRLTGTVSERPCPPDASGHRSPVIAVLVGYETVVLARSPLNGELDLTRRQIFLALAKWVPDPARPGAVRENASATWQQVDPALLPVRIQVMGPPLESAAGHSMIELLLEEGCDTFPWIAALESTDPARHARICRTVRRDGAYVASHGLDAADLLAEPNAVGIFGLHGPLSFYSLTQFDLNGLAVSSLDGVKPTQQGIVSGTYPGSRGLYLYVNRLHVAGKFAITLVIDEAFPYRDWAVAAPPPSQLTTASSEIMAPH